MISLIASIALAISTIAFVVILSIFEGLKTLNLDMYKNINPDLKITSKKGKELNLSNEIIKKIASLEEVKSCSKTLEEKVYLRYGGKNYLAYLKGVDHSYNKVLDFEKSVFLGESHLSKNATNSVVVGLELAKNLALILEDEKSFIEVFAPKPGRGFISEADVLKKEALASGIFFLNEEINEKYIYSSLEFAWELLEKKDKFYTLELKVKSKNHINKLKSKLNELLGDGVVIKTKEQQQEALFKMINTENLIIYLLLSLIGLITAFNLIGAIVILILNKKNHIYLLWALGARKIQIKNIFFSLGILITLGSWISGLFIGYLLVFLQKNYGFLKLDHSTSFPVEVTFFNFLISSFTILGIAIGASYFSSRKIPI